MGIILLVKMYKRPGLGKAVSTKRRLWTSTPCSEAYYTKIKCEGLMVLCCVGKNKMLRAFYSAFDYINMLVPSIGIHQVLVDCVWELSKGRLQAPVYLVLPPDVFYQH